MNRGNRQLPFLIAAVGGGVLFLSLFFEWMSGPSLPAGAASRYGLSKTGWELFSTVDILLAILAVATLAYCVLWLLGIENLPWLRGSVRWGGLAALVLIANYMVDQDNAPLVPAASAFSTGLGVGVYLALAGALAMFAGGLLVVRPDLAERLESARAAGMDGIRSQGASGQRAPGQSEPGQRGGPVGAGQVPGGPVGAGPAGLGSPARPATPGGTAAAPTQPLRPQPMAPQPTPPAGPASPAQPAAPAAPAAPASAYSTPTPPTPVVQQPATPVQAGIPPEPPAAHAGPPAGWYPDPQGLARLRYWDGAAWTEHTSA
ncbi:MAG: DUF2510 domain-containing protein [Actinobacteria bacterium]|nr:DUF2510 domain-containing protein [Actinomycetota bacterium]